jgi:hypothetical protein
MEEKKEIHTIYDDDFDIQDVIAELARTDAEYHSSSLHDAALSDLYIEATPEVEGIIRKYRLHAGHPFLSRFKDQITGKWCYDFAFLYRAFVEAKRGN